MTLPDGSKHHGRKCTGHQVWNLLVPCYVPTTSLLLFRGALVCRCLQCVVLLSCAKRIFGHLKTIGQGSSLLLAPAGWRAKPQKDIATWAIWAQRDGQKPFFDFLVVLSTLSTHLYTHIYIYIMRHGYNDAILNVQLCYLFIPLQTMCRFGMDHSWPGASVYVHMCVSTYCAHIEKTYVMYSNAYVPLCELYFYVCVCVYTANNMQSKYWFGRGVRHDCGTALNEATTIMGYWVWSTQRTCIRW